MKTKTFILRNQWGWEVRYTVNTQLDKVTVRSYYDGDLVHQAELTKEEARAHYKDRLSHDFYRLEF